VQQVNTLIGEISAAAAQQRAGIDDVAGSVTELDQTTQQNAALVEEAAAAAGALNAQASALAQAVSAFRLDSSAALH
jgi:methyl-accepting chemotaxis protein